jgi:hypothetical protein
VEAPVEKTLEPAQEGTRSCSGALRRNFRRFVEAFKESPWSFCGDLWRNSGAAVEVPLEETLEFLWRVTWRTLRRLLQDIRRDLGIPGELSRRSFLTSNGVV